MKTTVKFVLSTLVAAAAMTNFAMGAEYTWTEIAANGGNQITPGAGTNYKVTGNSMSAGGVLGFGGNNEFASKIRAEKADALWLFSGTVKTEKSVSYDSQASKSEKGDVWGAKYLTILGNSLDSSGPSITGKFRGAALQTDKDAEVFVYGGIYGDKFSAVSNYTVYNSNVEYNGAVAKTTGHLYIYGGEFKSDITGVGMQQEGRLTANTDIQILGKITNGVGMGVFGGIAGQKEGSASLVGNTSVTVSGEGSTSFIAGGNRMAATSLVGNIALTVKDGGTVGGVLGGNYINELAYNTDKASTSTVDGNIFISVASGNVGGGGLANGILAGGVNTNVTGEINVSISGSADVTGGIAGGSAGWDSVSVNKSNIAISGGTINVSGTQTFAVKEVKNSLILGEHEVISTQLSVENGLVGGNIAAAVESNAIYTMTESNISITGGKITGNIYGGGIAKTASASLSAKSTVESANITIDASENKVTINGNIYGGGRADTANSTATVGTSNVVFKGNGANLTFTGTVDGNGSGAGVCSTGNSTFTFDGYTGAFNGTIQNFDELVVKNNSAVTGANGGIVKIENIAKVTLKDTSTLKLETAVSSGGKLEINGGSLSEGSSVELTANASVTVTAAEGSVTLTSIAGNVVVTEATQLDVEKISVENAGKVLVAWDFVVENAESGVTVTMDVGEGQVLESLRILHEENGEWTDVTSVVTDKKLENGKLSFTAKDFSGYAVATPEPSMFGLMAGLGALVLVGTRRRRK